MVKFIISNSRSSVYLYTAVDNDGPEDPKPPDSKRFQLETDEMLRRIRETEAKIVSYSHLLLHSTLVVLKNTFRFRFFFRRDSTLVFDPCFLL